MKSKNTENMSKSSLERIKKVTQILEELKLNPEHLNKVLVSNPSKELPYHNSQHLLTVAINSYEGAKHYSLTDSETRTLFLAALYHDWNHTGSDTEDIVNINKALRITKDPIFVTDKLLNNKDIDKIQTLIKASEYPHKKVYTISEKILQDADMFQYLEKDSQIFIEGIGKELNFVSTQKTTTQFLKNTHFNTAWGENKIEKWLTKI